MVVFPLVPVTPATRSSRRGVAPEACRHLGHRRAGIGDASLGHRQVEEPLDHQRHGALFHGQAAELVAVRALSRNTEEEGAPADAAAVVGKAGGSPPPHPRAISATSASASSSRRFIAAILGRCARRPALVLRPL